ncbi:MAG TPA: exosortase/archaeosortase family protein [Terriglobales bacterium]|nr:exosortase/archaeosortase family protein [Terriglobales bacterium]
MSCASSSPPPWAAIAAPPDAASPCTSAWFAAALLLVALTGLYAPVLLRLAQQWWSDSNDSYGFLVPLFCLWLLLRQRRQWRALPFQPARSGWLAIAAALALLLVGQLGSELLFTRLSLLLMLAGLLLALLGRAWLRCLAFPLGFLAFMIPLPTLIYNQLTLPLQGLATRAGVGLVAWTGIPVLRQGNLIMLPGAVLDVVAACSGIRSLLALLALATAYGYLTEPRWGRRLLLVLAMPPLAVASNAVRIGLTILLTLRFGDAASHGLWHLLTGLQVFLVALAGLVLLQRLLGRGAAGPARSQYA